MYAISTQLLLGRTEREFDHFWNWFVKNKLSGALQLLKTFAQKYRIVPARSPWVSDADKFETIP